MLLPYLKRQDIKEYLSKGFSYQKTMQLLNVSRNAVTRMKEETKMELITIRHDDPVYDPAVQQVMQRILVLSRMQVRGINRKQKKRLSSKEIYHILNKETFKISLNKTRELFSYIKNQGEQAYLHIHHPPGEYVEFDYGQLRLPFPHEDRIVYFAVFTFPYSNFDFCYVSLKQDSKAFVDGFNAFVKKIGKVPPKVVFDNMKIAKDHRTEKKNATVSKMLKELSNHYSFEVQFCTPYSPWQKGGVENSVKRLKKDFIKYNIGTYSDLEEVRNFVDERLKKRNESMHPVKNDTRVNLLDHELPHFNTLPKKPFIYAKEIQRTVSSHGFITYNYSKYEVGTAYKGNRLNIRITDQKIYILGRQREVLAKYNLTKEKGTTRFRIWYSLKKIASKPNHFIKSLEYKSMPKFLKILFQHAFKENPKHFSAFMSLLFGQPKNLIKKYCKRKQIHYNQLTSEELLNLVL
ncbi:IS21 family transposase [Isachenkonia alkalipeptolytica]|uniref:IS21 family transposase n=1 Tax=Isachenkonia alkalipeptolytica TaxID=2565777 RepID=A0AA43XN43_9CLOT|nr:IS21 family transposase [Isachenkonia alkalipeptolytica]NBG89521.1 IS21 family transposase [Isachenkonia alkalipeptolytica]